MLMSNDNQNCLIPTSDKYCSSRKSTKQTCSLFILPLWKTYEIRRPLLTVLFDPLLDSVLLPLPEIQWKRKIRTIRNEKTWQKAKTSDEWSTPSWNCIFRILENNTLNLQTRINSRNCRIVLIIFIVSNETCCVF